MTRRFGDYESDEDIIAIGATPAAAATTNESQLFFQQDRDELRGGISIGDEGQFMRSDGTAWKPMAPPPDQPLIWWQLDRNLVVPSDQWVPVPFTDLTSDHWDESQYGSPGQSTVTATSNGDTLGGATDPGGDNVLHVADGTQFTTRVRLDPTSAPNYGYMHTHVWLDILFPATRPGGVSRGTWDVAGNPSTWPSGAGVNQNDWYVATSAGTINADAGTNKTFKVGDYIVAAVNTPSSSADNDWSKTESLSHVVEYSSISSNDITCIGSMSEGTLSTNDVVRQAACGVGHRSPYLWIDQTSIGVTCPSSGSPKGGITFGLETSLWLGVWSNTGVYYSFTPCVSADDVPDAYQFIAPAHGQPGIQAPSNRGVGQAWYQVYQTSGETLQMVDDNAKASILMGYRGNAMDPTLHVPS